MDFQGQRLPKALWQGQLFSWPSNWEHATLYRERAPFTFLLRVVWGVFASPGRRAWSESWQQGVHLPTYPRETLLQVLPLQYVRPLPQHLPTLLCVTVLHHVRGVRNIVLSLSAEVIPTLFSLTLDILPWKTPQKGHSNSVGWAACSNQALVLPNPRLRDTARPVGSSPRSPHIGWCSGAGRSAKHLSFLISHLWIIKSGTHITTVQCPQLCFL